MPFLRKLKKSASFVPASLSLSTYRIQADRRQGADPLACDRRERFTQNLLCTSLGLLLAEASPAQRRVGAGGWEEPFDGPDQGFCWWNLRGLRQK